MKFHLYRDTAQEWRWKLKAANGQIIADSGEGYKRKSDCLEMIVKIIGLMEDDNLPVIIDRAQP